MTKTQKIWLLSNALLSLGILFSLYYTFNKVVAVRSDLSTVRSDLSTMRSDLDMSEINTNKYLESLLVEKTETIVAGARNDEEKAVRLARWVAANIRNVPNYSQSGDPLDTFSTRSGLCGSRALLFVRMLWYKNIPGRVINLYNFPSTNTGHSCAQVWYDGQWHLFDVSYAGYFQINGKILSWEQIKADPGAAIKGMVVFEDTADRYTNDKTPDWGTGISLETALWRYGDDLLDWSVKVDNTDRMKRNWTVENIENARSAGFYGCCDIKTLYPQAELRSAEKGLVLGRLDNSYSDVDEDGNRLSVSQYLGLSLGTKKDFFHTAWEFKDCTPQKTYRIIYHLYGATQPNLSYWVRGLDETRILSGEKFVSDQLLKDGAKQNWEIIFEAAKDHCGVLVGYDFREPYQSLLIDQISIGEVEK